MGMSTHVTGFTPPDEKYHKMRQVYDACTAAGIAVPEDVVEFFDWSVPSDHGTEVKIQRTDAVEEYKDDVREGYDIILEKLPPNVKVIRVYNSW